jgi:hypothetical protein
MLLFRLGMQTMSTNKSNLNKEVLTAEQGSPYSIVGHRFNVLWYDWNQKSCINLDETDEITARLSIHVMGSHPHPV